MKKLFCLLMLTFLIQTFVLPQSSIKSLSGPRIGVTAITGKMAAELNDKLGVSPLITQFGWQFEWRFFSLEDGPTGVVEFVPLIGGVEQGKFLPSISGLFGMRSSTGFEFGIGPNVSLSGLGIVLASGVTLQKGQLNWPINFAISPSSGGIRFTLLLGFNAAKD